ncbi:hypothetical protein [Metapseudomonas resinovorans]|uniref:Uncharacterized protein n=1 Tax=Metapseudomonas resinovorans NBRC 106553 TaxID=1245471 RepID=S6ARE2_METRE|nr:hypothetical protein [Pseudomonas resinovorans]BAN46541.1 hypothetical protein PCA10_08090 [Pseudomonas resinovorans NBRC 106553]
MGELRRTDSGDGLYERLLHRLALALDEADTAVRLRDEEPLELELKGLTPAEMELIRAYLDRDTRWLRGWHAAAEELAAIESLPRRDGGPPKSFALKPRPMFKRRPQLCCAMCGTPAAWQRGQGVQACMSCGSQLFRTSNPR